jgi:AcrR family transcriptional regulator
MPRHSDPALLQRRRGQILQAAHQCFRERGFRLTTIDDVCVEARVSPGAFYRYFSSKADVIAAIALAARAEADAVIERLPNSDSLLEGLDRLAHAYLVDDSKSLLAEVWSEATYDPVLAKALQARERISLSLVTAAIERAQAQGAIYPSMAPGDAAETLLASLEGLALRRARRGEPDCAQAMRWFRALAVHILKPKR